MSHKVNGHASESLIHRGRLSSSYIHSAQPNQAKIELVQAAVDFSSLRSNSLDQHLPQCASMRTNTNQLPMSW